LCNVTFPYALKLATHGIAAACALDAGLAEAVNMHAGQITNKAVAETFGMPFAGYRPAG
jgi:alanine dehydrogenase